MVVAILFEAAKTVVVQSRPTNIYDVYSPPPSLSLSLSLRDKTNVDQHCLKNCCLMRRKELNYNKKVRVFGSREFTMD
ncbi:MAG: hypothetical protein M3M89_01870 [Thermoproteota archaeon]|nr:hypothetical protein [Thermoproteota archaeon]